MKTRALSLVLLSALALPLSAQDSPLVLKSSDPSVAMGVMSSFGSIDPLPDLGEGQHYVLTLGEDGFKAATGGGDAGLMQVEARPGQLMQMFSQEIAQYQGMAQGLMMMSMGQQGMKPAEVAQMVQGAVDFPNQVELLSLTVTGDIYAPQQGLAAELSLDPKDGTWFASLVDAVTQLSTGAPVLTDPSASMQGTFGLGLKSTEPLEPIVALFSGMGAGSEEDRSQRLEITKKMYENMNGAMSMTWNLAGGGLQAIAGLKDAATMNELMNDPAYLQMTTGSAANVPGVEVEYDPEAFEHRDVVVSKMTMEMAMMGMPNPLMQNGKMETYYAVAGDYWLTSMYAPGSDGIKAMIDAVMDQEIAVAPLPGDTLGTFSMQVGDLVDMFAPGTAVGETPQSIALELAKTAGQLVLKMNMK